MRADVGYDEAVDMVREDLGEAAFADAWATGRAMPVDQAIDEALASAAPVPTRSLGVHDRVAHDALARLTSREREVAALVAQRRSNREIGAALVIASRTADSHVGHILTKLNLHTRAQIAAWVVEHGAATG
jgi:DNA-binding NarL/FixJ family response regulator